MGTLGVSHATTKIFVSAVNEPTTFKGTMKTIITTVAVMTALLIREILPATTTTSVFTITRLMGRCAVLTVADPLPRTAILGSVVSVHHLILPINAIGHKIVPVLGI